jgi:hypothetical protein
MKRRIVAFHQDDEGHWVADLECGHTQHVRHDPPWQVRPWVLTAEGRTAHLGVELDCRPCAERRQARRGPPTLESA